MSMSELLLTLLVALIVFGPKKLPMLARHLGKLVALGQRTQRKVHQLWLQQQQEQQLLENQNKATQADKLYQNRLP